MSPTFPPPELKLVYQDRKHVPLVSLIVDKRQWCQLDPLQLANAKNAQDVAVNVMVRLANKLASGAVELSRASLRCERNNIMSALGYALKVPTQTDKDQEQGGQAQPKKHNAGEKEAEPKNKPATAILKRQSSKMNADEPPEAIKSEHMHDQTSTKHETIEHAVESNTATASSSQGIDGHVRDDKGSNKDERKSKGQAEKKPKSEKQCKDACIAKKLHESAAREHAEAKTETTLRSLTEGNLALVPSGWNGFGDTFGPPSDSPTMMETMLKFF